jgi:hypothetical protein
VLDSTDQDMAEASSGNLDTFSSPVDSALALTEITLAIRRAS